MNPNLLRAATLASALAIGLGAPALAQTTPVAPPAPAAEGQPADAGAPVEVLPDLVLGREDAPVTVIEYASFTCPHCADFAKENMPKLKADYIDTGKVKFIQRPVYFDAVGLWAGILAQCDPAKYYPIGEILLTTQPEWVGSAKSGDEVAANLRKIGLAAGMTEPQMDACWNDRAKIEQMVATYQINATKDDLQGTPSFIIGGEKVPNQPWEQLKAKIDEKVAQAPAVPAPTPAATDAATPATSTGTTTPITAPAAEATTPETATPATPAPVAPAAEATAPVAAAPVTSEAGTTAPAPAAETAPATPVPPVTPAPAN